MVVCTKCNRDIEKLEDMKFCPFCGSMFDYEVPIVPSKVSQQMDIVWGNQGAYAQKVVMLSHRLVELLHRNLFDQDEEGPFRESSKMSNGYFEDQFNAMRNSHSNELFSQRYNDLLREAYEFYHTSSVESSSRKKIAKVKSIIVEFEKILQLPYQTTFTFQSEENYDRSIDRISVESLDKLYDMIDALFEKVNIITAEEGLFILLNADFEQNAPKILDIVDYKDICSITTEKIHSVIGVISEGFCNQKEFYSIDDYYIVLFLEALWLYLKAVCMNSIIPENKAKNELILKDMSRWVDYIEISIDRSKYHSSLDMTTVYQEGYDFVNEISDKFPLDKEGL